MIQCEWLRSARAAPVTVCMCSEAATGTACWFAALYWWLCCGAPYVLGVSVQKIAGVHHPPGGLPMGRKVSRVSQAQDSKSRVSQTESAYVRAGNLFHNFPCPICGGWGDPWVSQRQPAPGGEQAKAGILARPPGGQFGQCGSRPASLLPATWPSA